MYVCTFVSACVSPKLDLVVCVHVCVCVPVSFAGSVSPASLSAALSLAGLSSVTNVTIATPPSSSSRRLSSPILSFSSPAVSTDSDAFLVLALTTALASLSAAPEEPPTVLRQPGVCVCVRALWAHWGLFSATAACFDEVGTAVGESI